MTTPQAPTEPNAAVVVEQRHRDAASKAAWDLEIENWASGSGYFAALLVQAFARFEADHLTRIASENRVREGAGEMLERVRQRLEMRQRMPGDVNATLALELECLLQSLEEIASLPHPTETRRDDAGGEVREKVLEDALRESKLQLEYIDDRFPTGTTPAIIAIIEAALAPSPQTEQEEAK